MLVGLRARFLYRPVRRLSSVFRRDVVAVMLLPWDYGVRNLARRPLRTGLTLVALSIVVTLIFVVVGFIRGLEQSLASSGQADVVLIYSINAEENIENSAIPARTPAFVTASVSGTLQRYGVPHMSPELYLGTRVTTADDRVGLGLVRGVTARAALVREAVRLTEGRWPGPGEVIVGRLAATKIGVAEEYVDLGQAVEFEGLTWRVVGRFAAGGTAYESEVWCDLNELQNATKRQDIGLLALKLAPDASPALVSLFCKERTDLELTAISETAYYQNLQSHYRPVRMLAWLIVALVAAAGIFAGMNMMYGAVSGRVRELATLQAIGYRRRAITTSLVQEGVILASAASLLAGAVAYFWIDGLAVRFTMGAFTLRIDSMAVLIGCGVGLSLGVLGALPPALKALRQSVAISLKAV